MVVRESPGVEQPALDALPEAQEERGADPGSDAALLPTDGRSRAAAPTSDLVIQTCRQALPLRAAGVGAGGALLAGVPEGARLRTLAAAAHTLASAAAHLAVVRNAGRRLRGAVAVVADVAGVALTLPAVTLAVTWARGQRRE